MVSSPLPTPHSRDMFARSNETSPIRRLPPPTISVAETPTASMQPQRQGQRQRAASDHSLSFLDLYTFAPSGKSSWSPSDRLQRVVTPSLCCRLERDVHSRSRCQSDEHFQAKLFPLSPREIGNSGLTDPQNLRRFGLRKLFRLNELPQISHKISSHLKNCGLLRRIPHIGEYISG
jgi:hypothetical protein